MKYQSNIFDTNHIPAGKNSRLDDISIELRLVMYVWKFVPEREERLERSGIQL
jgi:hypothetical protein